MKIIISPAKKMKEDLDFMAPGQLPELLARTETLAAYLRGLDFPELQRLLGCNEQIARQNYERFADMDLRSRLTPALLAYEGIQYQYMAPGVFTDRQFDYIAAHLRILSGFYGILRPFDGVTPYRLEMQARLKTSFCDSLYDFWKDDIYQALIREDSGPVILNLASDEYAKAVRPFCTGAARSSEGSPVRFVTPVFGEYENGRIREKGVYVKMARGEMVRFLAEKGIEDVDQIRDFDRLGYVFSEKESLPDRPVFLKEPGAAASRPQSAK